MNRRSRRGSYNVMLGVLAPVVFGFAALAVDGSWMHLARTQSQDVADAASHAALIQLRYTGSTTISRKAADLIVSRNIVGGGAPKVGAIDFGYWDRASGDFEVSGVRPNAVRVAAGRYKANPMELSFSRIWGIDEAEVNASATAATRSLHVVLVMDITGSFRSEIHHAKDAAVAFIDVLSDSHGEDDMIGMSVFTYRYAWEWTPMLSLDDPAAVAVARAQWGTLNVASKDVYDDEFATGGLYPQMPREYKDEPGTDHHVGMVMGAAMMLEMTDPFAYRAMVVLTDGDPNGLKTSSMRADRGYVEHRWREYAGPTPHSQGDIETKSVSVAQNMYNDHTVHVWTVSFRAKRNFLKDMPQGDGKFYFTTNAAELTPIFEEIANSMPLLIVK